MAPSSVGNTHCPFIQCFQEAQWPVCAVVKCAVIVSLSLFVAKMKQVCLLAAIYRNLKNSNLKRVQLRLKDR